MSESSKPPGNSPGDRHHLKFNRDVLPEFKRRTDAWEHPDQIRADAEKLAQQETDSILKWVGVGILVLVVAAIAGVTMFKKPGAEPGDDTPPEVTPAALVGQERDLAKEAVKAYMGSSTLSARLKHVRRPETVAPLMEAYFGENELYPLKIWNFEQVEPRSIEGRPFWYAVVNTPEGREIVLLEKTSEGFKIDWETHVGLNPMVPEDYVRERPEGEKQFRVYVSPDEYYNGPFSDPEKYLSAKLEFANSGVTIFGYIEKISPDHSRFLKLVDRGEQVPLILSLEWPQGSEEDSRRLPQIHIRSLVAERWVLLD